ncbi:arylsulfatase [Rubellicoccus peritrichatus]|uniref:Arylsulfatase n=1 Tax=Rubellicoccus peritrichatus TaxID=3080537 RepID=A0AAQ3L6K9_9BACT|nr:arylsulfatase [Puniceicoccus sp. CR14]WOO39597.1 arylsulfatase [Puniceicoccus sp. CR14]
MPAGSSQKPNVLLILTDDQGYGDYSCTGNPWLRTPNLDKLYSESVRLHDFHLDPMCAPSRAALLTGKYSAKAGVWSTLSGRYFLNRDIPTMADHFKTAGYRTGMFGKWHMGDSDRYLPHDRGFDEALYHGGGVIGEIPDYWDNDYFNSTLMRNGNSEVFTDKYCTDIWFDETISFIERHTTASPDKPFFCYLSTNAPHWPHDVHENYSNYYLEQGLPESRAKFYGMIANIDENFGRLNTYLKSKDLDQNTILLFMGDNGTDAGASVDSAGHMTSGFNAGMRGKKCWAYDGGHRNLCIIRWPNGGLAQGPSQDVDRLTAHIDLLPTLLDLCNITSSDQSSDETESLLDGWSLADLLRGDDSAYYAGRTLVVHNQQKDNPVKFKDYEVLTEDWRLAQSSEWGEGTLELTDKRNDPGQRHNLLESHGDIANELKRSYEEWWSEISKGFNQSWPFYLGLNSEIVTMTAHAWHSITRRDGIYAQSHCRTGEIHNGYLLIEIEQKSRFEFRLRRWPKEIDTPIRSGVTGRSGVPYVSDFEPGLALKIHTAKFHVESHPSGNLVVDESVAVGEQMCYAAFQVHLDTGLYRILTTFIDDENNERGAYYLDVMPV